MDELKFICKKLTDGSISISELHRQLKVVAENIGQKPISKETISKWKNGEVSHLRGRSLLIVKHFYLQTIQAEGGSVGDYDYEFVKKYLLSLATLDQLTEVFTIIVRRLERNMKGRVISRIVRDEFIRQQLSVDNPRHITKFTSPAGSVWEKEPYCEKLQKLLAGTMEDCDLSLSDLDLIAACLYEFSGNTGDHNPYFTTEYLQLKMQIAR